MAWRSPVLRGLVCFSLLLFLSASISANKKKPPARPVNINTASSEELQQVPGIGPATAQKILQMRKSYGPFKSVDDLLAIRGLGQKRLDKMRKFLTVGKSAAPKAPPAPAKESPNTETQTSLPQTSKSHQGYEPKIVSSEACLGGKGLPPINTEYSNNRYWPVAPALSVRNSVVSPFSNKETLDAKQKNTGPASHLILEDFTDLNFPSRS